MSVTDHNVINDRGFISQLENCTLPPELFSHEAHLRLAWLNISRYGTSRAIEKTETQILRFTEHLGARDKYNKTLTVAAVKTVAHFIGKSSSLTFNDFMFEFPVLKNNFRELIAAHYGFDIFNSPRARSEYLEPDLQPYT